MPSVGDRHGLAEPYKLPNRHRLPNVIQLRNPIIATCRFPQCV